MPSPESGYGSDVGTVVSAIRLPCVRFAQKMRPAWVAISALCVAGALSGCVRFTVDLVVSDRDNVSGSIVLAYPQAASLLFESNGEISDLSQSYASIEGARERGYDQDGYIGTEIRFDEVAIETFSRPGVGSAPLTITRQGDELRLEGSFDFSGFDAEEFDSTEGFAARTVSDDLGDMYVSVVLPGEILGTNGVVNDGENRVSWRLSIGETNTIYATALSPVPTPDWVWWAIFGGVVVVAGGVGYSIVRVRRGKPDTSYPEGSGRVPPVTQ